MRISDWSSDVCSSDLPASSRLASLLGLASGRQEGAREEAGRVLYIGSFSKVLFPSIRVGYLVVPENLVDAVSAAQGALGAQPTAMIQPVLAAFIDEGHFATHVRRMRRLYATRQAALVARSEEHTSELQSLMRISYAVFCLKKKKN